MIAAPVALALQLALTATQSPLSLPGQLPTAPGQPLVATGLIVGRVVDGSNGRPVAGVIVTLDGAGGSLRPRAMTNANGQFVFRKLTKGSYTLTATRPGYVDGGSGRRQPNGQTAPIPLDEGGRASDIVIPVWKHAAVGGTVVDEAGEPMIGVEVRTFQRRYLAGRLRIVGGPTATTDDRGIYRIAGLTPGDYLVAFVWREASLPVAAAQLTRAPSAADPKSVEIFRERMAIGGGSVPGPANSSEVQVGGTIRDLPSTVPVPPPAADEGSVAIYPTQFYPAAPTAARAAVITLASGQQREGVDFALTVAKTSRVSGTLVGPDGPMANAGVRLAPSDDMFTDLETSATITGAAGDFTLLGVPPGQYTIKVLRLPRQTTQAPPSAISDDQTLFAETPVSVGNRDVTGVLLTLQRGARLSGRVEFDGTRERPDASAMTRIIVVLDRADATTITGPFTTVLPGRADETGAFKTYGVAAGKYIVRISGAPSGWTLKSVTTDGRDISEQPLDLRTADVTNVVITFTDRPTRLTGTARTAAGNADPDALVVVFPPDPGAWADYGFNPRRLRSTHTAKDGSYAFTGLPAGEYWVAAIPEENADRWQDPRVLDELARAAMQVRLGDGDTRMQDVKTAKGGGR